MNRFSPGALLISISAMIAGIPLSGMAMSDAEALPNPWDRIFLELRGGINLSTGSLENAGLRTGPDLAMGLHLDFIQRGSISLGLNGGVGYYHTGFHILTASNTSMGRILADYIEGFFGIRGGLSTKLGDSMKAGGYLAIDLGLNHFLSSEFQTDTGGSTAVIRYDSFDSLTPSVDFRLGGSVNLKGIGEILLEGAIRLMLNNTMTVSTQIILPGSTNPSVPDISLPPYSFWNFNIRIGYRAPLSLLIRPVQTLNGENQ